MSTTGTVLPADPDSAQSTYMETLCHHFHGANPKATDPMPGQGLQLFPLHAGQLAPGLDGTRISLCQSVLLLLAPSPCTSELNHSGFCLVPPPPLFISGVCCLQRCGSIFSQNDGASGEFIEVGEESYRVSSISCCYQFCWPSKAISQQQFPVGTRLGWDMKEARMVPVLWKVNSLAVRWIY